jgi:hypothetical protein
MLPGPGRYDGAGRVCAEAASIVALFDPALTDALDAAQRVADAAHDCLMHTSFHTNDELSP